MESSTSPTQAIVSATLLLRNLILSVFFYADKLFGLLAERYDILQTLRCTIISSFLFILHLFPFLFPGLHPSVEFYYYPDKPNRRGNNNAAPGGGRGGGSGGDVGSSSVARGLSQLFSIMTNIPVSSGKYEVVRSLAGKLIDENLSHDNPALIEVNCSVLSSAFSRTLRQLEGAAAWGWGGDLAGGTTSPVEAQESDVVYYGYMLVSGLVEMVKWGSGKVWSYVMPRDERWSWPSSSPEKLAAELLWLAEKMAACGCAEEAVQVWASAGKLACVAVSAELRLQGSLVKVSAFLIKQAKEMGRGEQHRQTKMKLLMTWLPLLCRANNGADAPVFSMSERTEMEAILEQIIETLESDEQERVLAVWLHHYTFCSSADWPNLHGCYNWWFNASRRFVQT